MNQFLYTKKVIYGRILFYIFCIVTILSMDKNALDNTSFCIIYHITNKQCLGCGLSRAFFHVAHFDFKIAYGFNRLVVVFFPAFLAVILYDLVKMYLSLFPIGTK